MTAPMAARGVVVLGAGQAGFQLAASLREQGYDGPVALVGDEAALPYQRPPLSKGYLTGAVAAEALALRPEGFYADHRIALVAGDPAVAVDRAGRQLRLASGASLAYDHLVFATGARNRRLPVPGHDLAGVLGLRSVAEAETIRQALPAAGRVAIVGAGFIGLELAAVARQAGARVTVIEVASRVMARAVSPAVSAFFGQAHAQSGVELLLGTAVARILGRDGRASGVETADGRRIPADLVLVGIGVEANAELAAAAGLPVDNGIVVDARLQSPDPAISAIGDCAAYPSVFADGRRLRLESVQNAVDQARAVAARLSGHPAPYRSIPWFWSDQGPLRLQMAGLSAGHEASVLRGDPAGGRFSVFCFRGGRLAAVESVNRPADHMAARRLLAALAVAAPVPELTPEQAADPDFDLKAHAAAVEAALRRAGQPGV